MADEDIAIPIALPLFNDSDPVISALENPRSVDFGIVISISSAHISGANSYYRAMCHGSCASPQTW
jgi:hypothetical protein